MLLYTVTAVFTCMVLFVCRGSRNHVVVFVNAAVDPYSCEAWSLEEQYTNSSVAEPSFVNQGGLGTSAADLGLHRGRRRAPCSSDCKNLSLNLVTYGGRGQLMDPPFPSSMWPPEFSQAGSASFAGAVFDGESVWFIPCGASGVIRVFSDNETMRVYSDWPRDLIRGTGAFVGGVVEPRQNASSSSYIWMIPFTASGVVRVSANDGTMTLFDQWPSTLRRGNNAFQGGVFHDRTQTIWLSPHTASGVIRIDSASATATDANSAGMALFDVWPLGLNRGAYAFSGALLDDNDGIWLIPYTASGVVRVDANNGTMALFDRWPEGLELGTGAFVGGVYDRRKRLVWLAPMTASALVRIHISSGTMTLVPDPWPTGFIRQRLAFGSVAFDGVAMWLIPLEANGIVRVYVHERILNETTAKDVFANASGGSRSLMDVTLLSPPSLTLPQNLTLGDQPFLGSVFDGRSIWLAPYTASGITRLEGWLSSHRFCSTTITRTRTTPKRDTRSQTTSPSLLQLHHPTTVGSPPATGIMTNAPTVASSSSQPLAFIPPPTALQGTSPQPTLPVVGGTAFTIYSHAASPSTAIISTTSFLPVINATNRTTTVQVTVYAPPFVVDPLLLNGRTSLRSAAAGVGVTSTLVAVLERVTAASQGTLSSRILRLQRCDWALSAAASTSIEDEEAAMEPEPLQFIAVVSSDQVDEDSVWRPAVMALLSTLCFCTASSALALIVAWWHRKSTGGSGTRNSWWIKARGLCSALHVIAIAYFGPNMISLSVRILFVISHGRDGKHTNSSTWGHRKSLLLASAILALVWCILDAIVVVFVCLRLWGNTVTSSSETPTPVPIVHCPTGSKTPPTVTSTTHSSEEDELRREELINQHWLLQSFSPLLEDAKRLGRPWRYRILFVEDLAVAWAMAVLAGWLPDNQAVCQNLAVAACLVTGLHLLYLTLVRPYQSSISFCCAVSVSVANFVLCIVCCGALYRDWSASVFIVGIASIALQYATLVFEALYSVVAPRCNQKSPTRAADCDPHPHDDATMRPMLQVQNPLLLK